MCAGNKSVIPLQDFIARLERYVNLDTPSGNKEALDAMSSQLKDEFEAAGCRVITHERAGGNILECRIGNGEKQILLLGHMDTVFPVGTVQERPFAQQGDLLFGPGVLDMKSGVLMILEILRYYSGNLPDGWSLCALLNGDEEIGSKESSELIVKEAEKSVACLCMEPSKPDYCTVARKGLITFRVKLHGVAAHSGVNYLMGHSAVQAAARMIGNLYTLRDDERGISINIGRLSGGCGKSNVVADSAEMLGEVRCYDPEEGAQLEKQLACICADTGDPEVTSEFAIVSKRPPMRQTEPSRALYELAKQAAEKNGLTLNGRTHGGGSDGSIAASAGIPVVDGMGAEGEFSHTDKEYVKADTILPRLQTCIDLIGMLFKN